MQLCAKSCAACTKKSGFPKEYGRPRRDLNARPSVYEITGVWCNNGCHGRRHAEKSSRDRLANGTGVTNGHQNLVRKQVAQDSNLHNGSSAWTRTSWGAAPEGSSGREKSRSDDLRRPERTPSAHDVSRADPVIEALERALNEAVAAKKWTRVAILAREMANRQEALASANVVSLPNPKVGR